MTSTYEDICREAIEWTAIQPQSDPKIAVDHFRRQCDKLKEIQRRPEDLPLAFLDTIDKFVLDCYKIQDPHIKGHVTDIAKEGRVKPWRIYLDSAGASRSTYRAVRSLIHGKLSYDQCFSIIETQKQRRLSGDLNSKPFWTKDDVERAKALLVSQGVLKPHIHTAENGREQHGKRKPTAISALVEGQTASLGSGKCSPSDNGSNNLPRSARAQTEIVQDSGGATACEGDHLPAIFGGRAPAFDDDHGTSVHSRPLGSESSVPYDNGSGACERASPRPSQTQTPGVGECDIWSGPQGHEDSSSVSDTTKLWSDEREDDASTDVADKTIGWLDGQGDGELQTTRQTVTNRDTHDIAYRQSSALVPNKKRKMSNVSHASTSTSRMTGVAKPPSRTSSATGQPTVANVTSSRATQGGAVGDPISTAVCSSSEWNCCMILKAIERLNNSEWLSTTAIQGILEIFLAGSDTCYLLESGYITCNVGSAQVRCRRMRGLKPSHKCILSIINHQEQHWTVAVIERDSSTVQLYDPLHTSKYRSAAEDIVRGFLDAHSNQLEVDAWRYYDALPRDDSRLLQSNGIDCGVYAIVYSLTVLHQKSYPTKIAPMIWRSTFAVMLFHHLQSSSNLRSCKCGENTLVPVIKASIRPSSSALGSLPFNLMDRQQFERRLSEIAKDERKQAEQAEQAIVDLNLLFEYMNATQSALLTKIQAIISMKADATVSDRNSQLRNLRLMTVLTNVTQCIRDASEKLSSQLDQTSSRRRQELIERRLRLLRTEIEYTESASRS